MTPVSLPNGNLPSLRGGAGGGGPRGGAGDAAADAATAAADAATALGNAGMDDVDACGDRGGGGGWEHRDAA